MSPEAARLRRELNDTLLTWRSWTALFRDDEDVFQLLYREAPLLAGLLQYVLKREATAGLARLLGRESSAGQRNLVLMALLSEASGFHDTIPPRERHLFKKQLECIRKFCEPAIRYRHKRLSHLDWSSARVAFDESFTDLEFDLAIVALHTWFDSILLRAGITPPLVPREHDALAAELCNVLQRSRSWQP